MKYNLEKLTHGLNEYNIYLTDEQLQQFLQYYDLLISANRQVNLTAVTKFDEVVDKHFLDSLSIAALLPQIVYPGVSVQMIDIGSGAGFPGIPIKIACPDFDVILVEPLGKKAKFLEDVILKLDLRGIAVVQSRAEDLAREAAYRQCFDLCISRAVTKLPALCEYCLPFVRMGGMFVAYKGGAVEEELDSAKKAISTLGGTVNRVKKFDLPGTEMHRSLVAIDKIAPTPDKYPRRAGVPTRRPI